MTAVKVSRTIPRIILFMVLLPVQMILTFIGMCWRFAGGIIMLVTKVFGFIFSAGAMIVWGMHIEPFESALEMFIVGMCIMFIPQLIVEGGNALIVLIKKVLLSI